MLQYGRQRLKRKALISAFYRLFFVVGFFCHASNALANDSPQEYKLKAAFLYNFAKFVKWPESQLPTQDPVITFCVTDLSLFPGQLENIARKQVGNRSLIIKEVNASTSDIDAVLGSCHLLFVDESEESFVFKYKDKLTHVLTVGENNAFHAQGGMISFYQQNGKLRFSIHIGHANKAGITINSRLLRLAKVVGE